VHTVIKPLSHCTVIIRPTINPASTKMHNICSLRKMKSFSASQVGWHSGHLLLSCDVRCFNGNGPVLAIVLLTRVGSCPEALHSLKSGSWSAWAIMTPRRIMRPSIHCPQQRTMRLERLMLRTRDLVRFRCCGLRRVNVQCSECNSSVNSHIALDRRCKASE